MLDFLRFLRVVNVPHPDLHCDAVTVFELSVVYTGLCLTGSLNLLGRVSPTSDANGMKR